MRTTGRRGLTIHVCILQHACRWERGLGPRTNRTTTLVQFVEYQVDLRRSGVKFVYYRWWRISEKFTNSGDSDLDGQDEVLETLIPGLLHRYIMASGNFRRHAVEAGGEGV